MRRNKNKYIGRDFHDPLNLLKQIESYYFQGYYQKSIKVWTEHHEGSVYRYVLQPSFKPSFFQGITEFLKININIPAIVFDPNAEQQK